MRLITRLAHSFVAGDTNSEAIQAVAKLKDKGIMSTLDILGESVKDRNTAEKAAAAYLELLDVIKAAGSDAHISLKLTQQGLDIDTEFCYQNVRRIVEKARTLGTFVRIDMEGTPHTQRTLDLFLRLRREFDNVGIVIQAYLHRSEKDVHDLNKAGARIRLCKGAYKEPASVALQKMDDIRAAYRRQARLLLDEGRYPALATHDESLIQDALQHVREKGYGRERFELQMLYGLRPKRWDALVREGWNVRIYVPYGTHWFPYFYRRLRERKENVFFVLRGIFE